MKVYITESPAPVIIQRVVSIHKVNKRYTIHYCSLVPSKRILISLETRFCSRLSCLSIALDLVVKVFPIIPNEYVRIKRKYKKEEKTE